MVHGRLSLSTSLVIVSRQNGNVTIADVVVLAEVRLGVTHNFHIVYGIIHTAQLVHHFDGVHDITGAVRNDGGAIGTGAFHPSAVNQDLIGPILGQQGGVKGHLPFGHPTVVTAPAIHHFNTPGTVHRTADQIGETGIGVIHIGHVGHIRRINRSAAGSIRIYVGIVRIDITLVCGIGPAIVPRSAHHI